MTAPCPPSSARLPQALLALALTLAPLPALADPLADVLRACTTRDIAFADRLAAIDAATGAGEPSDRQAASALIFTAWSVSADIHLASDAPDAMAEMIAYGRQDAAIMATAAPDGQSLTGLAFREWSEGVLVLMGERDSDTCMIALAAPLDPARLDAAFPRAAGIEPATGPFGTGTLWETADFDLIEVVWPDTAALAALAPDPLPATFLRVGRVPSAFAE